MFVGPRARRSYCCARTQGMKNMKRRILNKELAALVAQIRHGEMIFIADAGSGTSPKAIYPLDSSVQYIDLEAVTGSPSFHDIFTTLKECGVLL